jgi:hypothetical protein
VNKTSDMVIEKDFVKNFKRDDHFNAADPKTKCRRFDSFSAPKFGCSLAVPSPS